MRYQRHPLTILIISAVVSMMLLTSCTENPFFVGEEILAGNSKISGQVNLAADSPDNVLVWLEGFDIAVRTDSEGNFDITLPVPAQQPNNGLTGAYNLYFYVANYWMEVRSIVVLDGYIEDDKGDIGTNGELSEVVEIEKMLSLFSDLEPDKINGGYAGNIECAMTLQATRDSVRVVVQMDEGEIYAGFIVPRESTSYDTIQYERTPAAPSLQTINTEETVWIMVIEDINSLVPFGDYEVIPYIVVLQPFVPPGLMNRLGDDAQDFTISYLDIPFKRGGGKLHIEPGGGEL